MRLITITLDPFDVKHIRQAVRSHNIRYEREMLNSPRLAELPADSQNFIRATAAAIDSLETKVEKAIAEAIDLPQDLYSTQFSTFTEAQRRILREALTQHGGWSSTEDMVCADEMIRALGDF